MQQVQRRVLLCKVLSKLLSFAWTRRVGRPHRLLRQALQPQRGWKTCLCNCNDRQPRLLHVAQDSWSQSQSLSLGSAMLMVQ